MKRSIQILLLILMTISLFATSKPSLDGRAVVADEGILPRGLFAKTVGYLPGDSVSVTNPATGVTVNVLVLGSLDPSAGIAIMLSPEAADKLFISPNVNTQVKITKRMGLLDQASTGSAILSADPDKDTEASIPSDLKENLDSRLAEYDENKPLFPEDIEEVAITEELPPTEEEVAVTEEVPSTEEEIAVTEELPPTEEEIAITEEVPPTEEEIAITEELPPTEEEIAVTEEVPPTEEEIAITEELPPTEEEIAITEELPLVEEEVVILPDEVISEENSESESPILSEEEILVLPVDEEVTLVPEEIAPAEDPLFKEEVTSEEEVALVPEEIIPEEAPLFPEEITPEEEIALVPEEIALVPEEIIPEEIAPEEAPLFSEEIIPEEEIALEPEEIIPEEEIALEPEEIIPEEEIALEPEEIIPEEEIALEPEEITPEEEIASLTDETDPYAPIILVPAQDNPPQAQIAIVPEPVVEDSIIKELEVPEAKPQEKVSTVKTNQKCKIIPTLSELESGKYYVQIATLSQQEYIDSIIQNYGKNYPIVMVPLKSGTAYQVMIGPLTIDEYGSVISKFKSFGYKDAFLRKIR